MLDDQTKEHDILEQLLKVVAEESLNLDMVAAIAGDREFAPGEQKRIEGLERKRGPRFYSDLLFIVTYKYFPYEEAQKIWNEIIEHKKSLNARLGRNVGITVAALDYLTNLHDALPEAGIIPGNSLEEIAEAAVRDGLTRLFDKTTLESLLTKEVQRFARYGNQLSLAMIDIDDFKKINDTHGHQKGDEVLSRIGDLLDRETRDVDLAGRYGGEEFMIVFPQTTLEEAIDIAERFRARVESEFQKDVTITVSIGVANCPAHAKDTQMLIASADKALYEAKRRGKNRVCCYCEPSRSETTPMSRPKTMERRFDLVRSFTPADLLTLCNAACGTLIVFMNLTYLDLGERRYLWIAFGLFPVALLLDVLDGWVARRMRRKSALGADLDSLADIVSFGVAPAVLGYTLGLRGGWDVILLVYFVACGISRLARYNVTAEDLSDESGKVRYYQGAPIPSSLVLVILLAAAYGMDAVDQSLWLGDVRFLGMAFHPLVLAYALMGSAMISSRLRVPKP